MTKCLIFNLEFLAFMDFDSAKEYYNLIKTEFPDTDENLSKYYNYFENIWFPLDGNNEVRYTFKLWSYKNKFEFKGTKKNLINEDKLKDYIFFTNNACESFNHLMNSCLTYNTNVSYE